MLKCDWCEELKTEKVGQLARREDKAKDKVICADCVRRITGVLAKAARNIKERASNE